MAKDRIIFLIDRGREPKRAQISKRLNFLSRLGLESELDEMGSFVDSKKN